MGATVTGVCSGRNVEMARALGADHVIDYTQENYTEGDTRYDAIIDMVGNHWLSAMLEVTEPDGVLVLVGSMQMNPWWGPLADVADAIRYQEQGRTRGKVVINVPPRQEAPAGTATPGAKSTVRSAATSLAVRCRDLRYACTWLMPQKTSDSNGNASARRHRPRLFTITITGTH